MDNKKKNDLRRVQWQEYMKTITAIFSDSKSLTIQKYMLAHNSFYQCFTQCTTYLPFLDTQAKQDASRGSIQYYGFLIYSELEKFLINRINDYRKQLENSSTENLLQLYLKFWEDYQSSARILPGITPSLSHWVKREHNEGREIYYAYDLTLVVWRDHLLNPMNDKFLNEVMNLVRKERNGECIDTLMISAVRETYVQLGVDNHSDKHRNLGIYKSLFETIFLRDSEQFYIQESTSFLETRTISDYLKLVDRRLTEENQRVSLYLHEDTREPLIRMLNNILIVSHSETILNEFKNLVLNQQNDDIRRMYGFFLKNPIILDRLILQFKVIILSEGGAEFNKCESAPPKNRFLIYVEGIIKVYKKYHTMVAESFLGDTTFHGTFHLAVSTFINTERVSSKSSEYLAKYCNYLLKQGNSNLQDQQLEDALDDVMIIFQFLENKDIFQTFYTSMLATRLVDKTSSCDDSEASMISRLKSTCGFDYTNKLQKMFQDITTSKDLLNSFKEGNLSSKENLGLDFNIQVLCVGSWPSRSHVAYQLPGAFERAVANFTCFYNTKYSGRRLTWLNSISQVELVTNGFKQRYTLHVNALQAAILLQFNDKTSFTVEQLSQNVAITEDIALQLIAIFLKTKLLTSTDSEENLNAKSVVNLFVTYRGRKLRLHLNVPLKTQVTIDENKIAGRIQRDRKLEIDAAIVRVMKMRKALNHQQLTVEVMRQLSSRFKPTIQAIKQSIGGLIDREYIERGLNPSVYVYKA